VRLVLDTTAYVAFKQNISAVVEYILKAERILFSPVVLAELMFGFRGGTKFTDNMAELNLFLEHPAVAFVRIGEVTADRYSRIAMDLSATEALSRRMIFGLPRKPWNMERS
jgi:tRNA(fMet)-specific endonuclease VapC